MDVKRRVIVVNGSDYIHQVSVCATDAPVIHTRSTQRLYLTTGNECNIQGSRSWNQTGSVIAFALFISALITM